MTSVPVSDPAYAVELSGVTFAYSGAPVVEDVSLSVPEGDFVGLVGPNGGGKTTLLRLMLGFLVPMEGTVRVLGTTPAVARGRVGYVPQTFQFDPRFPLTIGDAVRMGCLGLRTRRERLAHLVDRALDRVGLGGFGSRPFEALSGGQRQRVLIARAIVADPEILLLDEPTAHVDPAVQRGIYALLREIGERMTVILVTHDAGFVSELVRSVYCVNHRVTRHGVLDLPDASDALLRLVTGGPFRVVAHDESCQEEADGG